MKAAFNRVNMVYQYLVFEQLARVYQAFGNIGTISVNYINSKNDRWSD